jgi:hypothetical protein
VPVNTEFSAVYFPCISLTFYTVNEMLILNRMFFHTFILVFSCRSELCVLGISYNCLTFSLVLYLTDLHTN